MSISLSGSLLITGSLTASGTLTAQTLVVQTVTSSIVYSSGSNIFGNSLTNTQQMTGSLRVTGSGNHYILGGNIGIGTSSPTGTYGKLSVAGGISILNDNNAKLEIGRYSSGAPNSYIKIGSGSDSLRITNAADSVDLVTFTNGGNVVINSTVANYKFQVNSGISTSTATVMTLQQATDGAVKDAAGFGLAIQNGGQATNAADLIISTASGGSLVERMRILANGRVGINTNAPDARLEVQLGSGTTTAGLFYNYITDVTATLLISRCGTTSGFYHFQAFSTTTTEVFRIESNGNVKNSNNSYGSLSDIKIKDNVTDATPKLEDLLKVRIRNYNIIGQDVKQIGVIAQELEEIFPSMVDEHEDFEEIKKINEEGNSIIEKKSLGTFTKSVKYSVFVPMLIKAIQEQQATITSLQEQITELKNK